MKTLDVDDIFVGKQEIKKGNWECQTILGEWNTGLDKPTERIVRLPMEDYEYDYYLREDNGEVILFRRKKD